MTLKANKSAFKLFLTFGISAFIYGVGRKYISEPPLWIELFISNAKFGFTLVYGVVLGYVLREVSTLNGEVHWDLAKYGKPKSNIQDCGSQLVRVIKSTQKHLVWGLWYCGLNLLWWALMRSEPSTYVDVASVLMGSAFVWVSGFFVYNLLQHYAVFKHMVALERLRSKPSWDDYAKEYETAPGRVSSTTANR